MPETCDPFRPRHEPALTIYVAFQREATHRESRHFEAWAEAEIQAVHQAAAIKAQEMGLRVPTRRQVEQAEVRARGHVDYGLKWALGVAEAMAEG